MDREWLKDVDLRKFAIHVIQKGKSYGILNST